jgi:hypothetical protein
MKAIGASIFGWRFLNGKSFRRLSGPGVGHYVFVDLKESTTSPNDHRDSVLENIIEKLPQFRFCGGNCEVIHGPNSGPKADYVNVSN